MEEKKYLKKKRIAGSKKQLAELCHEFGDYYNGKGKYGEAMEQYTECASLYDQLGLRLESGKAHRMIGEMYMLLDQYDEALQHENIYLCVARDCLNKVEEQRALATLGRIHLVMGQCIKDKQVSNSSFKAAEKACMKSLVVCESLKGVVNNHELMDMRARLLLNIGVVQQHTGNDNRVLEFIQKAIVICKTHDFYDLLNHCYIREGDFHMLVDSDMSKALLAFNLAYDVAGRLENKVAKQCEALSHKADVLCKMADFYSAKSVLKKAWKMKSPDESERKEIERKFKIVVAMCYTEDLILTTDSNDHKKFKNLYEKLGDGACSLNNFKKGVEYYNKMLEHAVKDGEIDKQLVPIYVSLYQTYKDMHNYEMALEFQTKEYEIVECEPAEAFTTLICIAETLSFIPDSHKKVVETYAKALELAKHLDKKREYEALNSLVEYLEEKGFTEETTVYKEELIILKQDPSFVGDVVEEGDMDVSQKDTPNIGDKICLNDVTDESNDEEENKTRTTRTRGKGFTLKKNAKGESQLHQACISGNTLLVTRLLAQGHPVNVRDNAGWLPIHEACIHGNKEIVEILIKNGAHVDDRGGAQCDGITPMQDAASNGFLEIVELLIDSGASPSIKNDHGQTVLDILRKWRAGESLHAPEQILYDTVCQRIQSVLGRLGETPIKTPTRLPEKDIAKRKRTHSFERKRNLLLNDDEEDLSLALTIKARKRNVIDDESSSDMSIDDKAEEVYTKQKSNAVKDYRDAMELLRNRNKTNLSDKKLEMEKDFQKVKQSAHLAPNEVDDDWLEEDVRQVQSKKRKRRNSQEHCVNTSRFGESQRSPFKATGERIPLTVSAPVTDVMNNIGILECPVLDNELYDSDSISVTSEMIPPEAEAEIVTAITRHSSLESIFKNKVKRSRWKRQLTLTKSGFTRYKTDQHKMSSSMMSDVANSDSDTCTNLSYNSNENITNLENVQELDSTFVQNYTSPLKLVTNDDLSSQQQSIATASLKVKIQDKLITIPVALDKVDTLTVTWLLAEVSQRYYIIEGIHPSLSIRTSEGVLLADDANLSFIAGCTELNATITSWTLPLLTERYVECSDQCKTDVIDDILKALKSAQVHGVLRLVKLGLSLCDIQPVFQSLNHQIVVTELFLQSNCFGNDGIKCLASCLPTLINIRKINLCANGINYEGLRHLLISFQESQPLFTNLIELDLSYNHLCELGFKCVMNLTSYMKIRWLNIRCCDMILGSCDSVTANLQHIQFLDLSHNNLQKDVIKAFLDLVNPFSLETLKLEALDVNAELFVNIMESNGFHQLHELDLSRCNLRDADVKVILRSLSKCENLKALHLRYNKDLTVNTFKQLIEHNPPLTLIDLEGCVQIFKYTPECDFEENWFQDINHRCNVESLTLTVDNPDESVAEQFVAVWKVRWGNAGIVKRLKFGGFLLEVKSNL